MTPPASTLPDIVALFAERPWCGLDATCTDAAETVPTMLSAEERQLYFWLAAHWDSGTDATVDLGCFAGGSTARLAAGHDAAGHPCPVHAYDRFTADKAARERHLYPAGIAAFDDPDILLLAHRLLTPWKPRVRLHEGDILTQHWAGGRIGLLVVDAAKSAALADHIATEFFPALVPGRSILVHQDFLHRLQPWLPAQMELLASQFTPLARVARDCMVFLCTGPVTPAALAAARTESLADAAMVRLVRMAARRLAPLAGQSSFAAMVRKLRANPGARNTRSMWRS